MKLIFSVCMTVFATTILVAAEPLQLVRNAKNDPAWSRNPLKNPKDSGTVEYVPNKDGKGDFLRFATTKNADNYNFYFQKYIGIKAGDKILLTVKYRGVGSCCFGAYIYNADHHFFSSVSIKGGFIALPEQWREKTFEMQLRNGPRWTNAAVCLVSIILKKNSTLEMASLQYEIVESGK